METFEYMERLGTVGLEAEEEMEGTGKRRKHSLNRSGRYTWKST